MRLKHSDAKARYSARRLTAKCFEKCADIGPKKAVSPENFCDALKINVLEKIYLVDPLQFRKSNCKLLFHNRAFGFSEAIFAHRMAGGEE
jgi:hypothetical protein